MSHSHHIARLTGRIRANLRVGALLLSCALVAMFRSNNNLQPERSVGRNCDRPTRRSETATTCHDFGRVLGLFVLVAILATAVPAGAAEPGEPIPNFANLTYAVGGVPTDKDSNITTVIVRSPATIRFMKYVPSTPGPENLPVAVTSYDPGTGVFTDIPQPSPTLEPTVPLVETPSYYLGETFYLWLEDKDQNIDDTVIETIILTVSCSETGDSETLRLSETLPDSGIFTGYLPSTTGIAPSADGQIVITDDCHLEASYTDSFDLIKTVTTAALVDPYGFVFDSTTGELIDGATVTLIDTSTGLSALVYGDDGISIYQPDGSSTGSATVVTGGTATDESNKLYQMPEGGFRFPYVLPGTYQLLITPPDGYSAPTLATDAQILTVKPDAVLVLGSRGEEFIVNPGPALRIDIPVDPAETELWLRKSVDKNEAAIGDFVLYQLELENNSPTTAREVEINDRLPLGFRYQQGSSTLDGKKSSDPAISADGRTLTFQAGDMASATSRIMTYVVEVAAGAKLGQATNTAIASDRTGATSNRARARIQVREDFFRNDTFLIGRVLTGSCEQKDTEMDGLPGVRIYLEDGSYVVTDSNGKYHFEGIDPGIHVVQVDLETLPVGYEMIPCEQTSQFAGRTFSQFVDLHGGTLWRVNFYASELPAEEGDVTLQLKSTLEESIATFRATINANTIPANNLRVTMMLPGKAEYIKGSAQLNGQPLPDPMAFSGAMTLRGAGLDAGATAEFSIKARLETSEAGKELPVKALLTFDTPSAKNLRTPLAENRLATLGGTLKAAQEIRLYPHFPSFVADLQETDRAMLKQLVEQIKTEKLVRVDIVGHSDNRQVTSRSRHIFSDNQALSKARARSVAVYLQEALDIPAEVISLRGLGESMPIADNNTDSGRALNRRVELYIVTEAVGTAVQLEVVKGTSDIQRTETAGASPTESSTSAEHLTTPMVAQAPDISSNWLAETPHETRFVWPSTGYSPINPSTRIILQHPKDSKVELRVNAAVVPALNFDTRIPVPNSDYTVALWDGVDIANGKNQIEAIITDRNKKQTRITKELWYISEVETIELREGKSALIADGITQPTLALKLMDQNGNSVRPGMRIEYQVSKPYLAVADDSYRTLRRSADIGTMTTGVGGIAYVQLEPTTQAGEVTIALLPGKDLQVSSWLHSAPRNWILVGFAEGTAGYNNFSGNQVSLDEAGIDEHFYDDGQVKFFAKGAIKGDWLLTMAYDSDKPDLDGDSLYQIIDPDTYYPLYGDGTNQGYEASSADKLFLKLERDQFYALFGDMNTGLTQTELSRYERNMSGFKSEMQTYNFSYTMFAADTKQAFVKDEIRGDGTSGRYYLTQKGLVINSEEITLETRDRFRSEIIIETTTLQRHTDYDIDYDAGSLFFKKPVQSKDQNFNPVFIVARYETLDSSSENFNYGGRAAVRALNNKVEVGATYVHEERGAGDGDLYGVDTTVKLTPETTLHLEAATTDTDEYGDEESGDAYLAEIEHNRNRLGARAYYREQDKDFGLGQLNNSEIGTRKYGAEARYNFTPRLSMTGLVYREEVLDTNNKRDVAEIDARYRAERYSLHTGLRHAKDRLGDGSSYNSEQLLFGGDWITADRKLTVRADHEQSFSNRDENTDYPSRTTLGLDYQLNRSISAFAEQELTWGGQEDTESTRVGLTATPWQGGEVRSTVERQMNENGQRVFAIFGLGQTWRINQNWSMDASLDRSYTVTSDDSYRFNDNVSPAQGSDDDFTSISVGSTYRKEKWTWWNRLETRQADNEDKYGVSTSVVAEPQDGVAVSAKALAFISDVSNGVRRTDGNIRMGMAYRPAASRWILLNRLDFYFDREDHSATEYDNWRIVNNLHANFRLNRRLQMSFYYGLKYVRDNYNGSTYSGYTDLISFEARYNINKRWDVGVHGSVLHSWNSDTFEYSAGADIGYSPMTNTWISLGYNVVGFEDEDFSSANYTAQGAYMRFRAKFDQQSVRDAAEWMNK